MRSGTCVGCWRTTTPRAVDEQQATSAVISNGKADLDSVRRIKRYVARENFKILRDQLTPPDQVPQAA